MGKKERLKRLNFMENNKMPQQNPKHQEKLKEYRKNIDRIDKQIIGLLKKRFEISKKIGEYKKQNNLPVKNKKREKQLIEKRIKSLEKTSLKPGFIKKIFKLILKESRKIQKN